MGREDPASSTCPSSFLELFPKELGPRILEYGNPYGREHRCRLERQAQCQEKSQALPKPWVGVGVQGSGRWGMRGCLISLALPKVSGTSWA